MRGAYGGPRVLLRRLREVMAEPVTAQEKLDRIVILIAANMVAEVCSSYVLRVDGELELYATEGLNPGAVHQTTLARGEGLVGLVAQQAEPLNLSDAQAHPSYSYKPETGEEIYHSFLGVPILRAGNTLGVLVVQNKAHRTYSEEEVEALQTTAMVMAEMIASGELSAIARPGAEPAVQRPLHAQGVPLAEGIGLGYAVLHEPRSLATENLIAEDVNVEVQRLDDAVAKLRHSLDELLEQGDVARQGEHREVLEAFRMFAHDRGWVRRMREAVLQGLTAEAAVERVQSDTRARMMRATEPFMRERLHDLDDLANRLLRVLTGREHGPNVQDMPENAILVARNMAPAALLDYERARLRGLIIEEAGPTSHVIIIARALGIATAGQVPNIASLIESGDPVIVDGNTGDVHVRPPEDVQLSYVDKVRLRARRQALFQEHRDEPAVTRDGETVKLMLNAGLMVDMPSLAETGANGIGLFRTELQFMVSPTLPRAGEQESLYGTVLDLADGKPVTFRTLDIGGDKVLPYLRTVDEENPALGWRAIRFGLDRPGILRSQVRALARASAGRDLRMMFPMIATVSEFDEARGLVEKELTHLRKWGHQLPERMLLGAMVEVPSILFELDELLERVDFISVGSNDLIQFMFAADRGNPRVADRFDPLGPAMLRAFKQIIDKAQAAGKPVTVCGEMASRATGAVALLGMGFRSLSVAASSVGPLKAMIRSNTIADMQDVAARLLAGDPDGSAHEDLLRMAQTAEF
ncbi:phosphoenolpyruvate--protein phosphotransferase [Terrihabitans rhizophilus]|uniref:phosphoenolpyruvate--protein phosphotransferase n=1 Tax=Terrihabitans rhizophilus TaxID=3092662 RepID=A0ABU4RNX0_9HYPH|nr:phosphoenolpyruvate--protein phosphotransferase [Terrihabitans sp. PJ23]MDX6806522.1 phosphoenolpyruvate--protein phosphotransferase [Terrihabitans sp. PJ23]